MDQEDQVCIPYKYSRYGVYSSHLFLLNAVFNYMYGFKVLTFFGVSLYTTSIMHWRNVKHSGVCKWLDVASSIATIFYVTLVDSFYFYPHHRCAWITAKAAASCAYIVNKYVEKYQLTGISGATVSGATVSGATVSGSDADATSIITYKYGVFDENESYRFLCLKYTKPNSCHRESAYLYSTFMHIGFLHVPLVFTCIYGVMNAPLSAQLSIFG
jgi:hypothetical protein